MNEDDIEDEAACEDADAACYRIKAQKARDAGEDPKPWLLLAAQAAERARDLRAMCSKCHRCGGTPGAPEEWCEDPIHASALGTDAVRHNLPEAGKKP